MKKDVKKNVKKNNDLNYKRALIFIMIVLIIIIISLFIFIKSNKNEEGLPNLGVGNINVLNYNTDPLGLADGEHVIFIDQNNINCNDSYTKDQAMNPDTPWCGVTNFNYTSSIILNPGDNILFKNGTYYGTLNGGSVVKGASYGGIFLSNINNTNGNGYITLKPYPGDNVTISLGRKYSNWTDLGNGIYSRTFNDNEINPWSGSVLLQLLHAFKENDFGITPTNNLSDLYNFSDALSTGIVNDSTKNYDFLFVNQTSKVVYLRLINGTTPDNIYLTSNEFEIDIPNVEINGFNIKYGLWLYDPGNNTRIINNRMNSMGDGILGGGDNVYIEGNDVNYIGVPLKYYLNKWQADNLDHAMYLGGDSGIVKNNHVSKCWSWCMHIWEGVPPFPNNFSIFNNIIEGGFVLNGYNFTIYNNVVYNPFPVVPFRVYNPYDNIRLYNNLFIGDNPGIIEISSIPINPTSIDIRNNIIQGNSYCYEFYSGINLSSSIINNNIYYGCRYFSLNYTNEDNWGYLFGNFDNYKMFMNSNFSLENNSFSADPMLNGTFGLLNESPAIDNVTCIPGIDKDFYGNPRPSGDLCDIGPFEFYKPVCNNGICDSDETCSNCPGDCGSCENPNNGGNGGSGGNGGNSKPNHNNTLKNNTNINLPLNQSTSNQSENQTIEFEKPENVVNYLVYFLMILCFIFLIIIIILLIVRYYKNKGENNYLNTYNLLYLNEGFKN